METAAYCADKVGSVTVIGKDDVPFKASLGSEVGTRIMKLFEVLNANDNHDNE